jgi:phytoene synthase
MKLQQVHIDTFRAGSKTYFNSSRFFPKDVRSEVSVLYAFVRTADNFVDSEPQRPKEFFAFRREYEVAVARGGSEDPVIDAFVRLSALKGFDPSWANGFFHSMALDLSKRVYRTIDETLEYVYGSAEVIGLYMAKILGLPERTYQSARRLGRAMQYINFIRDIAEDNRLGRTYLPISESSLPDLRQSTTRDNPEEYARFVRDQLARYDRWQYEGEEGFRAIPYRLRVPIQTASKMYNWTGGRIRQDPFIVYRRKVKPSRARIVLGALSAALLPRRAHG